MSIPKLHKGIQDQERTEGEIRSEFCNHSNLARVPQTHICTPNPTANCSKQKLFPARSAHSWNIEYSCCHPAWHCLGCKSRGPSMCAVSGTQLGSGHGHQPHTQHLDAPGHLKWNRHLLSSDNQLIPSSSKHLFMSKSYFPHLWREREVSMTCPLT